MVDGSDPSGGELDEEINTNVPPLAPGSMIRVPHGTKVDIVHPADVGGQFDPFVKKQFLLISQGIGIPYRGGVAVFIHAISVTYLESPGITASVTVIAVASATDQRRLAVAIHVGIYPTILPRPAEREVGFPSRPWLESIRQLRYLGECDFRRKYGQRSEQYHQR